MGSRRKVTWAVEKARTITFRVDIIVEPDDDGYHAYCPALKGLHVSGATMEEALQHARDAAVAYLRSLIKHGDPIPLEAIPQALRRPWKQGTHHTEELSVIVA